MFGKGSQSEVEWLRARVEFLEHQLTMIADETAKARLLPRPERRESTGKARGNWRYAEDRPAVNAAEAARNGHKAAVEAEQSFNDPRQP